MTLICKHKLKIVKTYLYTQNERSTVRLSGKHTDRQTDRQTDVAECINTLHLQVVDINAWPRRP